MKKNKFKITIIILVAIIFVYCVINRNKIGYYYDVHFKKTIDITKYPFYASGNGEDNETWAIQEAIDTLSFNGGGTVLLRNNHSFLSATIIMKDNVTLCIDENATLIQSNNQDDYVNYNGNTLMEYAPVYGHNITDYNAWDHSWYLNYPLIYAPENTKDIKITGKGKINMAHNDSCEKTLHIAPIGMFKVNNFEITDITIEDYNSYACMIMCCGNGIVNNIKIFNHQCENNDGIMLMNCNNIKVTNCDLKTGDDGIYIFSSFKDPRKSIWWNAEDKISTVNIEIANNVCYVADDKCKAFGMILWSNETEDVTIDNVNIHDNYFQTVGVWDESSNPFTKNDNTVRINNFVWKNNKVEVSQSSFTRLK